MNPTPPYRHETVDVDVAAGWDVHLHVRVGSEAQDVEARRNACDAPK